MKLSELECYYILHIFQKCNGDRNATVKELGIGLRTLAQKLRQYGVKPRAKTTNAPIPVFVKAIP